MQELSDAQLLCAYAEHGDEAAFREIVTRHMDFVYSCALRQINSSAFAGDLAQEVFTDLARKARLVSEKITGDRSLVGWLHRSTRYAALGYLRDDRRRVAHERQAMEQLLVNSESVPDWERISPVLDEVLDDLTDDEHEALLLRYFKNHDLRAVGRALGVSDDAAQKRVSRAVERLRDLLAKRGVTVGTSGLAVLLSANAVQAAPVGLAVTVSTTATLAGTTLASAKIIAMTTLQKTLIAVTVVAAGAGLYEAGQAAHLRGEVMALRRQRVASSDFTQQLARNYSDATNQLAALRDENQRLSGSSAELLRLRGELARARETARPLTADEANAKAWTAQVALLKQKLEQSPERKIPELQFATDKDWANAVWNADLGTEDGVREALSKVREDAENTFMNLLRTAIKKFAAAHENTLPADITQLKDYFDPPVQEAETMLKRYTLLQTGKLSDDPGKPLARLATYADEDYDSNHEMTLNGAGGGRFNRVQSDVGGAASAFVAANHGQMPSEPSQLAPYLDRLVDPAAIQKYLKQFLAEPPPTEVITLGPALKAYAAANKGRYPRTGFDLLPYLDTPEQVSALVKLGGLPPEMSVLAPAVKAFIAAHNGQPPQGPADLESYLTTPEQVSAIKKWPQSK